MRKITTKKRILFSFRGQVTINGQIMSEKPGIFCAQNGQKIVGFRTACGGGKTMDIEGFKKLVKKYGPLHAAFVNEALTGGRYYRNGSDILFGYEKEDTGDNTP